MTQKKTKINNTGASFRDPNGFIFTRDGILYRQVNHSYRENYTSLVGSGLYDKLVKAGLLIPHTESDAEPYNMERSYKVLRPEKVPFISYPYEWCFGQLKDAALVTLSIQKRALKADLSLKDASAYNIQFFKGHPTLIDTLSFEIYKEGEPWVAYKQFCQHFLAPLALMSYRDVRLNQLLRVFIDGIPLDLASRLLPGKTRWNLGLLTHLHWHARAQKQYADVDIKEVRRDRQFGRDSFLGLLESLRSTVRKLDWKPAGTEWADYYDTNNYSGFAFEHKKVLVEDWLQKISPQTIWDLGANTGVFSRVAATTGVHVVSSDIDPAAVEVNYRQVKKGKEQNLLPLVLDLTNPSPAIGWQNQERESFLQRGPVDVILALALIHHLAISNNVPLERVAEFFAGCSKWLIIEFVPKEDSQVKKLLRNRLDIFEDYTRQGFESAFQKFYAINSSSAIRDSERWLYLMYRK
jgi:2-polyprenyl-3-methyl-5-hydroxy-6-metoxy-1,4-benzoquinol methylase